MGEIGGCIDSCSSWKGEVQMEIATDVATIATIATPVAIGVGFFFAYRQLQSARNARMAQIVLSITQQWDSKDMVESRNKVHALGDGLASKIKEEINKKDSEELLTLVKVANFFDNLGLLVMEGCIPCPVAYRLFGRAEEHFYTYYRPILEEEGYKAYFQYYTQLNEAFLREKARCSPTRPRPVR